MSRGQESNLRTRLRHWDWWSLSFWCTVVEQKAADLNRLRGDIAKAEWGQMIRNPYKRVKHVRTGGKTCVCWVSPGPWLPPPPPASIINTTELIGQVSIFLRLWSGRFLAKCREFHHPRHHRVVRCIDSPTLQLNFMLDSNKFRHAQGLSLFWILCF